MLFSHKVVSEFPTHCELVDCSTPDLPILHHILEFAQTHVLWVSDAIQPSHPLPPPSPFAFNLSQHQGLFQWVSSLIRWPNYWSFSISSFNEYSGLTSFRIDWFDLLSIQGTLRSLLQHHSSEASILWRTAFFMAQLSHPYMTTGKTIAFIIGAVICQVISLLFNMLSRFLIAFLLKSKTRSSNLPIVGIKKSKCSKFESFEQVDSDRKLQIWDSEPGSLTL